MAGFWRRDGAQRGTTRAAGRGPQGRGRWCMGGSGCYWCDRSGLCSSFLAAAATGPHPRTRDRCARRLGPYGRPPGRRGAGLRTKPARPTPTGRSDRALADHFRAGLRDPVSAAFPDIRVAPRSSVGHTEFILAHRSRSGRCMYSSGAQTTRQRTIERGQRSGPVPSWTGEAWPWPDGSGGMA